MTTPNTKRIKLDEIDLSVEIDGVKFKTCLMNASGARCTTAAELNKLMICPYTGGVVSKSCTLAYREGNPKPRYYHDQSGYNGTTRGQPTFSINSTGLANLGMLKYFHQYTGMFSGINRVPKTKPYILSIAGLSLEENLNMIKLMQTDMDNCAEIHSPLLQEIPDSIELNLSCPNVIGKPQVGYDFEASEEVLRKVFEIGPEMKLGVKLPPYFDFVHYNRMAEVLEQFPISHITCINSLGNGLVIDWVSESPVIKPKGGFGGIGGSVIKPFALANVHKFSQLLPQIPVIGCGGVSTGWDAFEHILTGASLVQVGTQLMTEGIGCFERITKELKLIMQMKGYCSLDDFRGCLREQR